MATVITFDATLFREQFPAFADPIRYPDSRLQMYWDNATCYVSDQVTGVLSATCRQLALNYFTAHLVAISDIIANGGTYDGSVGLEQSASIDKVSVSLTPPPVPSELRWWLNTTPYGQQYLALMAANTVGGSYIGGLPETAAIRRVGGIFI